MFKNNFIYCLLITIYILTACQAVTNENFSGSNNTENTKNEVEGIKDELFVEKADAINVAEQYANLYAAYYR